jgi:clan AA aspartic protease
MGLIYEEFELLNAGDIYAAKMGYIKEDQVKKVKAQLLVDSGAYMLAINENVRLQLNLPKVDEQIAELANGALEKMDVVGPVEVRFKNRSTTCRAVVLPGSSSMLLGAIPMEDLDVVVNPRKKKLTVNPESPYLAKKSLKSFV